nr:bromodomain-containing protein 1 isoform X2 [Hydra vulgaris]
MDIALVLKNLQRQKYPLDCPFCGKFYRSFSGISYHVVKFHSDNPVSLHISSNGNSSFPEKTKKSLTYAESKCMVEFDLKGNIIRNLISEPLTIQIEANTTSESSFDLPNSSPKKFPFKFTPRKRGRGAKIRFNQPKHRYSYQSKFKQNGGEEKPSLPIAVYSILAEEEVLASEVPERATYYRYIEKPHEELDEEVEYGMDEEDYIWLEELNENRKSEGIPPVSHSVFEMLMDRLEKESYFETRTVTGDPYNLIDEDAVCSICCDGECSNSNVILFCDMCNLAVHQECYGVPYIPEGQWLCRRCFRSPSKPVSCLLCPTKSGAFKQTDTNHWAHVVCALWIPEVCFANTVFLEPIDSIQEIPAARWKLLCYICKKKEGACIQCFKTNCYTAFHVTCAQQGGLYMKIEPGRTENGQPTVKKFAYCDAHTPQGTSSNSGTPYQSDCCSDEDSDNASVHSKGSMSVKLKNQSPLITPSAKLKEVQKKLLEKQSFKLPAVHIPFVPAHRLGKIVSKVIIAKKSLFIQQLQSYWMLKRQSRNGVPLLRRLQANTGTGINKNQRDEQQSLEDWSQSKELKEQLRYWQQLRHDLERARLLIELIRKREKIKKEQYRMKQQVVDLQLKPLQIEMERTLQMIREKDISNVFSQPVDPEQAPDYHEFIKNPMDFSTMQQKLSDYEYMSFDDFEADFNLIIKNCMDFNNEDTKYYRSAMRLRKECQPILKAAKLRINQAGIDQKTGMHMDHPLPLTSPEREKATPNVDGYFLDVLSVADNQFMTIDEKIEGLEEKLNMSSTIQSASRFLRQKVLRKEIAKLKRKKRIMANDVHIDPPDKSLNQDMPAHLVAPPTIKKRGRKPKHLSKQKNAYNGEVKICHNTSPAKLVNCERLNDLPLIQIPNMKSSITVNCNDNYINNTNDHNIINHNSVNDFFNFNDLNNESLIPVIKNSSPGRNRRSGVLFKKKQYQPINPSPLVLNSSPKNCQDVLVSSPTNTNLSISDNLNTVTDNLSIEKNIYSEESAIIENSVSNTNEKCAENKQCLIYDNIIRLQDHTSKPENIKSYNEPDICIEDTIDNAMEQDICLEPMSRKRTYSSSANSDSENHYNKRKMNHKRGRQKSVNKLCLKDEFKDLEGLNDIKSGVYMIAPDEIGLKDPKSDPETLDMLTLVWAKCKGYPSYPALTIDPAAPRIGYQFNGVPISVPPLDVLQMNDDIKNYLILFFDARRTWQWLPRDKIEPLGLDSRLDEVKLIESKKPSMRKNVQEAYKRAILFRYRLKVGESPDNNVELISNKYESGFAECENFGKDVISARPNFLSDYLTLHSPIAVSLI